MTRAQEYALRHPVDIATPPGTEHCEGALRNGVKVVLALTVDLDPAGPLWHCSATVRDERAGKPIAVRCLGYEQLRAACFLGLVHIDGVGKRGEDSRISSETCVHIFRKLTPKELKILEEVKCI